MNQIRDGVPGHIGGFTILMWAFSGFLLPMGGYELGAGGKSLGLWIALVVWSLVLVAFKKGW